MCPFFQHSLISREVIPNRGSAAHKGARGAASSYNSLIVIPIKPASKGCRQISSILSKGVTDQKRLGYTDVEGRISLNRSLWKCIKRKTRQSVSYVFRVKTMFLTLLTMTILKLFSKKFFKFFVTFLTSFHFLTRTRTSKEIDFRFNFEFNFAKV